MKLAHVTATFPPYWGGTGNVAYHNARVLHERGHQVTVYSALPSGRLPLEFPFAVRYLPEWFRIGNAPLTPALLRVFRDVDLIHLHVPYIFGAELTAIAVHRHHIPLVVTYHNDLLAPGLRGRAFDVYSAFVQPRVLRAASQLIATSLDYAEQSKLARVRPVRPPVAIPNGVDADLFHPSTRSERILSTEFGIPEGTPVVLFVGAMDRAHFFKGVPVLIEALASLPSVHAVLVGTGDLADTFRDLAEHRIPGRAHFAPKVDLPRLISLYGAATMTVLPSTTMGEAFGMVLLESLACGTPVIASDLPGVRTVVDDGVDGFLVPPGNARALSAGIDRMCSALEMVRSMGESGRAKIEARYTWDRIGGQLESVYDDVLGRGSTVPALGGTGSG